MDQQNNPTDQIKAMVVKLRPMVGEIVDRAHIYLKGFPPETTDPIFLSKLVIPVPLEQYLLMTSCVTIVANVKIEGDSDATVTD